MKVVCAMSGGVDSSVAAALLVAGGYEVIGLTMKIWESESGYATSRCRSIDDVYDAKRVSAQLGIPHYVINLQAEFKNKVVDYFVREYLQGRTPNPCVVCNEYIKFGLLLKKAISIGADFIATGHYAKIEKLGDNYLLKKGRQETTEQSYFIARLSCSALKRTIFPLADYTKDEVREFARGMKLGVAEKAGSQEICFIPDNDYIGFLRTRTNPNEGDIIDKNETVLGRHKGIWEYTIGQRRRICKPRDKPFYVIRIDAKNNRVVVGDEADLYSRRMIVNKLHWVGRYSRSHLIKSGTEVEVKTRYQCKGAKARLNILNPLEAMIEFIEPQRAITPGQLAVFYQGDTVLGSGWIEG